MKSPFNRRASTAIANPDLQEALHVATSRFGDMRKKAFESTAAPLALRASAREVRRRTFDDLDHHLETLFSNLGKLGVQVHSATDASEAVKTVLDIARRKNVKTVVKSKSMATEEIHLNAALKAANITPFETDLGEWILQLAGEAPSHLVAPALHKTREQVARLFADKVDPNIGDDPRELTAAARGKLREEFLRAGMGISGVNFAIAETGTLCLVTNEGNGRLVTTLPKVHVAIMGIEKVVPTIQEALTLLAVLPRSATGQKLSSYFTMVTGPRKPQEADGPEEMHLIVLDNGRSRHLGGPFHEAFYCIRCGACQNACPVFQTVGGHAYDSVYGGPIGAILSPMLRGLEASGELSAASSLCGACQEACPVFVDIPRMLIEMREARTLRHTVGIGERAAFRLAGWAMRTPLVWQTGQKLISRLLGPILRSGKTAWIPGPAGAWLKGRDLPPPPTKSFTARWRDHQKISKKNTSRQEMAPGQDGEKTIELARRTLAISKGISHVPAPPPPGPLPEVAIPDLIERFCTEFELAGGHSYRHESMETTKKTILDLANRFSGQPIAVSDNLPLTAADWLRESGHEVLSLSPPGEDCRESLSQSGLGITDCDWAISETGTIILTSGPNRPRLYSLLPELHLVLIPEECLIPHLSGAGPNIHGALTSGDTPPSCVNLITGPSRSADIGLTLVTGVHGPCEIHAIIIPADIGKGTTTSTGASSPFTLEDE
ncbi:MAG: iron-sulfur cluster-binding protein [Nitrospinaceae bacterium]|nr:iron-sulfur cluster-binding protein [Nitrospinaceae bacterium]MBT6394810.1 iron-sulfur cluster-binding protein [Nitrospinaceae bacterium]